MAGQYCMACMRAYEKGETVCTCGHRHGQEQQPAHALRCGSVLNGKYLVGMVIGQGGFGITYVGLDLALNRKVAIKEYFPSGTGKISRNQKNNEIFWGDLEDSREEGYRSFLKEARKMAKVEDIPFIVGVRDVFLANKTAYIVMNFVEGETLKEKLQRDGIWKFSECIQRLEPVIMALDKANQLGIIHRDISPDNIMLTKDGNAWVLDMGASKDMELVNQNNGYMPSTQLVVKPGFSPPEQYTFSAQIGPWTDVYAMCATIFYCVTGKLPPTAPDRMFRDTMERIPPLTEAEYQVLSDGMCIDPANRIPNMAELNARLKKLNAPLAAVVPKSAVTKPMPEVQKPEQDTEQKKKKWNLALVAVAAILLLLCILQAFLSRRTEDEALEELPSETQEETQESITERTAPSTEPATEEAETEEETEAETAAKEPSATTPWTTGGNSNYNPAPTTKPKPPIETEVTAATEPPVITTAPTEPPLTTSPPETAPPPAITTAPTEPISTE